LREIDRLRSYQMRFYSLSILPDASIIDRRIVTDADLAASDVDAIRDLLKESPSHSKLELDTPIGSVVLESTRGDSGALLTLWYQEYILISSILLSGREPVADDELLIMHCSSIADVKIFRELSGNASPLPALNSITERPFLGSVIWPFIPKAQLDQVASLDRAFAYAYFSAITE
jgi:hypothetical protein